MVKMNQMPPWIESDIDPEFTLEKAREIYLKNKSKVQKIKFALENHPHGMGEGIIISKSNNQYIVLLTTDCKEHKVGAKIIVDEIEIYEKDF